LIEKWQQTAEAISTTKVPTLFSVVNNTSHAHFGRLHCSSQKHQLSSSSSSSLSLFQTKVHSDITKVKDERKNHEANYNKTYKHMHTQCTSLLRE